MSDLSDMNTSAMDHSIAYQPNIELEKTPQSYTEYAFDSEKKFNEYENRI